MVRKWGYRLFIHSAWITCVRNRWFKSAYELNKQRASFVPQTSRTTVSHFPRLVRKGRNRVGSAWNQTTTTITSPVYPSQAFWLLSRARPGSESWRQTPHHLKLEMLENYRSACTEYGNDVCATQRWSIPRLRYETLSATENSTTDDDWSRLEGFAGPHRYVFLWLPMILHVLPVVDRNGVLLIWLNIQQYIAVSALTVEFCSPVMNMCLASHLEPPKQYQGVDIANIIRKLRSSWTFDLDGIHSTIIVWPQYELFAHHTTLRLKKTWDIRHTKSYMM